MSDLGLAEDTREMAIYWLEKNCDGYDKNGPILLDDLKDSYLAMLLNKLYPVDDRPCGFAQFLRDLCLGPYIFDWGDRVIAQASRSERIDILKEVAVTLIRLSPEWRKALCISDSEIVSMLNFIKRKIDVYEDFLAHKYD